MIIANVNFTIMKLKIQQGVQWNWMGRTIHGIIIKIHYCKITKTIKDKPITRIGTKNNPAIVVKSDAGNDALKLASELSNTIKNKSKSKPKMFSK